MDNEVTTFEVTVLPYSHISLIETVEEGDKDINLTLTSKDKPKSTLLVNESDNRDLNLIMRRLKGSRSSVIFSLSKLQQTGKDEKTILAEKNWIYFTFQNHENQPVVLQVTAESKKTSAKKCLTFSRSQE
jgi:hypothetical protein